MKKILIILFILSINIFAQSKFYIDGSDLKPKDSTWGIDVDHIKIQGLPLQLQPVDTTFFLNAMDSIATNIDTLNSVEKIYLVNGTDTTEIYDNGDTVYVTASGNRPIKLNNITVGEISATNYYVLSGGNSFAVEGQLGSDGSMIFNNTMTSAEIQDSINMVPKNLGGHTFTFQFNDGTYTLDTALIFNNFYGGQININGNTGETGLHTNQAVILNMTGDGVGGIYIRQIAATVFITNIRVNTGSGVDGMAFWECNNHIQVLYCYVNKATTAAGSGFFAVRGTKLYVSNNYITGHSYGINSTNNTMVFSSLNSSTGTQPQYGLRVNGGVIITNDAQPAGSTGASEIISGAIY